MLSTYRETQRCSQAGPSLHPPKSLIHPLCSHSESLVIIDIPKPVHYIYLPESVWPSSRMDDRDFML